MADYYAIPTDIGEAKLANALALGIPLQITQLAVGDGTGLGAQGTPLPNPQQTALVSERRRAALNTLTTDAQNASVLVAEQVIPEDVGGWWIREMGLFDIDGDLIAVCNTPPTYKPVLASGSGRTQVVRMQIIVSDVAAVTLKVDPAIVLATRQYVDSKTAPLAPIKSPAFTGGPSAPTPAQFDADTSVATTEFVQRALGNWRSAATISSASSLTPAMAGQAYSLGGSTAFTIELPPLGSLPQGASFHFNSRTSSAVTLSCSAGDQISDGINSTVSSLLIEGGDDLTIIKIGAFWRTAGSWQVRRQAVSGASLSASGYQRFPSGLIIQWGTASTSTSGDTPVMFPVVFPNGIFALVASELTGGTSTALESIPMICLANQTNQGFLLAGFSLAGARKSDAARWIAIGY